MAFLAGFVKGFADQAVADADAERKRMAEMDDWQKKQLFMQKLEENAAKKKPVSSRFENGKMIYVNAYGEPVFERQATEQERLATEASVAEARGTIYKNDEKNLRKQDEEASAVRRAQINASNASSAASAASAENTRLRTKIGEYELNATQDMMGDLGPPSMRGMPGAIGAATGGGTSGLRYNAGDLAKLARVEGALVEEAKRTNNTELAGIIESTKGMPLEERIQALNSIAAELGVIRAE